MPAPSPTNLNAPGLIKDVFNVCLKLFSTTSSAISLPTVFTVCKPNFVATTFPTAPPKPLVTGANIPDTAPVPASFLKLSNVYFRPPEKASAAFIPLFIKAPVPAAAKTPSAILVPPVNGDDATAAVYIPKATTPETTSAATSTAISCPSW